MRWVVFCFLIFLVFFGGFLLWDSGRKYDLQKCKEKYGNEYILGHSRSNSSVKWCESPKGEMKSL